MKKLLRILVLGLFWCNTLLAKILDIENKIQIEVPPSHKFIRYHNEQITEQIKELKRLCKEFGFTAGMLKGALAKGRGQR